MSDPARLIKARDQVIALVKGASDLTDDDRVAIGELLSRAAGATAADVMSISKSAEEISRRFIEQATVVAASSAKVAEYKAPVLGYLDELAAVAPAALGKAASLTPEQRQTVLNGHHTAVALVGEICHHAAQCLKEAKQASDRPHAWGIEGTSTSLGSATEPPERNDQDLWRDAVARHAPPVYAGT